MALPIGTPRPCKGCGKTILKSKFCTNECRFGWYERTASERERARNAKRGISSWADRYGHAYGGNIVEANCAVCGKTFRRRRRARDQAVCCSRSCGFELKRAKGGLSRSITKERNVYRVWSNRAKRGHSGLDHLWKAKRCRSCSSIISKGAQRCVSCRDIALIDNRERMKQSPSYRAAKRANRTARRAKLRSVTVETFDPFEVFDRDRWRCHICGIKTPKRLRGTYEDNAPELDHIVPLAAGGEHSRRNTACSCRKCNIMKSDKPLGQLRLVA